jgi:uncharacterized alpha/beta hydrolase family protein
MIQEEVYELVEEEELTYEILEEYFNEQDRLIAEGKMQKPQITYGFDEESLDAIRRDQTLEKVLKEIEEKYGRR